MRTGIMLKPPHYTLELSNLALFGTDVEHKIKAASAAHEHAWDHAGKTPGIQIWRINKFKLEVVPENTYGTFYSGDSYILLHTYGQPGNLNWDIHFWLGGTTSQDEAGTAAYKTVELDNFLGEKPVQHREVQGFESQQFIAYFADKGGIRLLDGGHESGFHHVGPTEYRPRLLWVKGKKHVRVHEVPLRWDSLNHGDVFIVDSGLKVFVWQGNGAGVTEKISAIKIADSIVSERRDARKIVVGDDPSDSDYTEFATHFPAGSGSVKPASEGGSDDVVASTYVLFRISDRETGTLTYTEVAKSDGTFSRSLLKSEDAYVLDLGMQVYVWIGKGADDNEKKQALHTATDYITSTGRPPYLPVTRILESHEPPSFKSHFK